METILVVLLLISGIGYAAQAGITSAIIYSKKGDEALKMNEHRLYVLERLLIGISCLLSGLLGSFVDEMIWMFTDILGVLIAVSFSFPFFHDGMYYRYMGKILGKDVYPDGWRSESTTSTAKMSLIWSKRKMALLIGGIVYSVVLLRIWLF